MSSEARPAFEPTSHQDQGFLSTRLGLMTLVLLCAVQFMDIVDASIVNVALPSIQQRSGLLPAEPAVGGQRLHPHLRRLPAARRPRWPTCSAAGACSSPACPCSLFAPWPAGLPPMQAHWSEPGLHRVSVPR